MMKMTKMEREESDRERTQLMEMMRGMNKQITELEKKIEGRVNEKIKSIEKDILIKVNEEVNQKLEKFERRKNIIIYGLPESEGKDEKERCKIDHENIKQLIYEIGAEVDSFKVARLGKKIVKNKIRPIKVELDEESDKYKILKKVPNIKNAEANKFKKIIIITDMTLK